MVPLAGLAQRAVQPSTGQLVQGVRQASCDCLQLVPLAGLGAASCATQHWSAGAKGQTSQLQLSAASGGSGGSLARLERMYDGHIGIIRSSEHLTDRGWRPLISRDQSRLQCTNNFR